MDRRHVLLNFDANALATTIRVYGSGCPWRVESALESWRRAGRESNV